MKLQNLLLDENASVKDAIYKLEKERCKVVYVVTKEKKLKASVSDGDVRRYALGEKNVEEKIDSIGNLNPVFAYENEIDNARKTFETTDFYSIPIINHNHEITAVLFRNGKIVRKQDKLNIPIVIMAGGKGTRLYPYTKILPKALIPIGDIPITELIISNFSKAGCNTFYLIVNHMKNMIEAYFEGIHCPYDIKFIEEKKPLGTGGGLSLLKKCDIGNEFILTCCDILVDINYAELLEYHRKNHCFITVVLADYTHKLPYGVVGIDEKGYYQSLDEKPTYHYLINTGFYIVNHQVIEDLENNCNVNFTDIIEDYKNAGETIGTYIVDESAYMDMGQMEEMERMKEQLGVE